MLILLCYVSFISRSEIYIDDSDLGSERTTLNIGILKTTKGHLGFYRKLLSEFQYKHPHIQLNLVKQGYASYQQEVSLWLKGKGEVEVDIIHWFAGERLFHFARQGYLHPLNKVWQQASLESSFPSTINELVKTDGNIYGLPFTYYSWGMFYNNKVLNRLGIEAPTDWQSLLAMCKLANNQGITPIMLASKSQWIPGVWFDYLNLRINGLVFHRAVMSGKISFLDKRVKRIFTYWRELIEADCYNEKHQTLTLRGIFPPIYRQLAVSTLMVSFIEHDFPKSVYEDISYHAFPVIDTRLSLYEDVPVDVFSILSRSKNKLAAEKLIMFLSRPDIQQKINNFTGQAAPHLKAPHSTEIQAQQKNRVFYDAHGLAQFFDRDMKQNMVQESLRIINEFLVVPDVDNTLTKLEQLRLNKIQVAKP